MDFKKRIIEELEMTDIQADTLYKGYVQVVEKLANEYHTEQLILHGVSNWVAVKNALPNDDNQVFVRYENGKYGINEWWESDNCWKYNFSNMIVKEWCKPPCC